MYKSRLVGTTDRIVPEVDPIEMQRPSDQEFFIDYPLNTKPDEKLLMDLFWRQGRLSESHALWLVNTATSIMRSEPNLLQLDGPIVICGDIHGQFYDLRSLFEVAGSPSATRKFVFLGDYVDRGTFSIECLLYLYCIKILFPTSVYMLRGNHECRRLTSHFTFRTECVLKYSNTVYEACVQSFDALPLVAVVNRQFFCVHGGIGPDLQNGVEEIEKINRFQEPPRSGLFCDLLWSDPYPNYDKAESLEFESNPKRGCSVWYGYSAVKTFLERYRLLCLIRAHEVQDKGFTFYRSLPSTNFPSLVSLFSAPNYCDSYGNKGAVIFHEPDKAHFGVKQFGSTEHPFCLPRFENAFEWSLPFLAQKTVTMLLHILSICSEEELEQDEPMPPAIDASDEVQRSRNIARKKALALSKLSMFLQTLREESEAVSELKVVMKTTRLPYGSLSVGLENLRRNIHSFDEAMEADGPNERLPPDEEALPTAPQSFQKIDPMVLEPGPVPMPLPLPPLSPAR
ncbi:calcium-dependent serine/threonine protein phosphatase calcineurin catalytic subunit Ppb1 [Gonapodya prolifera JEL478]|uniref:Serine/threonine-protein phosphatase n=1 Tax=Gonapodya prolifera (strain JEL478) TaxID=1344416 RepID=A0A139A489_GONPJ|nr:calcium-dependent serine/threonine protein phosphatase calcineurin catalytic subunit Ppb1 [Gonapodya prolifera JEL478]|eukprot:KXS11611.1 calcium-dependent serine/threonine protein phosphatase calcineurin catalytic subunit Ppb1 [Gonapodya prolifera JEL478]